MALYGSLETIRAQAPILPGFAAAFSYVEELLRPGSAAQQRIRSIAAGNTQKVDLGEGVFAVEQVFESKARVEGFFESHRKYIDVQVVVEGEELMELADIARMKIRQPYDAERDLIVYEDNADACVLRVFPGQVAVYFPVDVHMPTLRVRATPVLVRKTVVKIPVS